MKNYHFSALISGVYGVMALPVSGCSGYHLVLLEATVIEV